MLAHASRNCTHLTGHCRYDKFSPGVNSKVFRDQVAEYALLKMRFELPDEKAARAIFLTLVSRSMRARHEGSRKLFLGRLHDDAVNRTPIQSSSKAHMLRHVQVAKEIDTWRRTYRSDLIIHKVCHFNSFSYPPTAESALAVLRDGSNATPASPRCHDHD